MASGGRKNQICRITPEGVTTPPCIVVGACAYGERENSMCRPILPTPPHLDALSAVPWRAGVEKNLSFPNYTGRCHGTSLYRGRSVCTWRTLKFHVKAYFAHATASGRTKPRAMAGGGRKNKVFRITPEGVTTPPSIVVGACAFGERENSMCRPILPTPPLLDALSPVPWRAGVEKINVFRIIPEGVTTPPCIVVGACAYGER
ncbi:hypothetical protein P8452_17566 [Trifolium repens]|nr:hypothetical protein P8452_17566 [Trifolium repens]